ncbi:MAG TPA: S53 family peptidase [Candidatus Binatia bacterium]|nr:S53 family peptidase [Candidatus Binatia bacterium]
MTTRIARASLLLAGLLAAGPAVGGPRSSLSPRLRDAVDVGRSAPSALRYLVVGLALRDRAGLDALLADLQNPASPRYHRFLTPAEFAATYAPTPQAEAAIVAHLEASGLTVTERLPDRLAVAAVGTTAAVERAFATEVHDVILDGRPGFAATVEPALPAALADHVVGVLGLDDLVAARPHLVARAAAAPRAALGRNCCHLGPADVASLYDVPAVPAGAGETVIVAGVYRWKDEDIAAFDRQWGLPDPPLPSTQVCTGRPRASGCRFGRKKSLEAALDVEWAHALAPGARVVNYMAASPLVVRLAMAYAQIVNDDPGHVVTTSWGACEANVPPSTQAFDDEVFASGAALGQAWLASTGDHGAEDCRGDPSGNHRRLAVDHPANSPHVVGVGGTTPTCAEGLVPGDPACAGYGGEAAWEGSGGGTSAVFARPSFQTGCGAPAGAARLVPDVALAADPRVGNYTVVGRKWFVVGGTSAATAMWAGLFARVAAQAGAPGDPAPRLYALCGTSAFHDVTLGSNGAYQAGPGYDLVTGLGSPDVGALLAAY